MVDVYSLVMLCPAAIGLDTAPDIQQAVCWQGLCNGNT